MQVNVAIYFQNGLTDLHTAFCKGFVIHWGWFLDRRYGLKSPGGAAISILCETNVATYLQNGLTDLDTVFRKGFVIHRRWFLDRCYGLNSSEGAAINIFRSLKRVLAHFYPRQNGDGICVWGERLFFSETA